MSYCEYPEFYSESFPRARKQYTCVECRAPVRVGERHLSYSMKFDGEMFSERQHLRCRALCMFIRRAFNHGECLCFGELKEWWSDWYPSRREISEDPKVKRARRLMARIKMAERLARKEVAAT